MATADEGSFIELLIANERVQGWLDEITTLNGDSKRLPQVLKEMADVVTTREAYAEEARKAGAVPKLTAFLKRCFLDDETSIDLISAIITACSGPMASGIKVRTLYYQGTPVTVKEGALGDGVGAKVWTVAHTLCQEMVENPEMVTGKSVLEIGAGCGPCGILAAKLGAVEVDISDYVDQLLLNLRDALHMNDLEKLGNAGAAAAEETTGGKGSGEEFDANWDPEDDGGSECSDLDAFFSESIKNDTARGCGGDAALKWECGPAAVRFLDWGDSVVYLRKIKELAAEDGAATTKNLAIETELETRSTSYCALDGASNRTSAPGIAVSKQYDVVLGTDILYEWQMAESVAAAVAHRLKPAGRCLLCCAVRDQAMFDALIENMRSQGLRVGVNQIQPRQEDGGTAPHDQPYEGGFVLIAAEHTDAGASDWHRDDLFPQ